MQAPSGNFVSWVIFGAFVGLLLFAALTATGGQVEGILPNYAFPPGDVSCTATPTPCRPPPRLCAVSARDFPPLAQASPDLSWLGQPRTPR